MAFLEKNPAFGPDAAVRTMCEGSNCGVQLLTAKILSAKENAPACGNCKFFIDDEKCILVNGQIKEEDLCDLHTFGKINPKDTKGNPKYSKTEVNYRHALIANLADPSTTTLTPLKEVPLLFRHKKKLHLVSLSSAVQEIIKKKKEAGLKIDDQELAGAFSECDKTNNLKSSFKTCTCEKNQDMPDTEQQLVELKSKYKSMDENHKELESKLKSMDEEKEKFHQAKKSKYAKMFASAMNEDEENKIMAILKAMENKEDMKTAMDVYEEHKTSKKAMSEDPEKKELMKSNKAMMAKLSEPMIQGLVAIRKNKLSESDLTNYETALKAQTYLEIQTAYDNESYLMTQPDSLSASTEESMAFPGEQPTQALSAQSVDEILESGN